MPRDLRHAARLAPLALLLGAGCAAFRSAFPSHEDVFKPVPLSIGEERVVAGDTAYVVAGDGYLLLASSREPLPEAVAALDGAARTFGRYLGAPPARLVVDLRAAGENSGERGQAAMSGDTLRLPLRPPRRRSRGEPVPQRPIAAPVVQAWVDRWVAARATGAAGTVVRDATQVPAWLPEALVGLLAPGRRQELELSQLVTERDSLIPLARLLDSTRALDREAWKSPPGAQGAPGGPDGPEGPGAGGGRRGGQRPGDDQGFFRGRRLDPARRFATESVALAQFLAARESPEFVGTVAERALRGVRPADLFAGGRMVPRDLVAFQAQLSQWLAEQSREDRGR